MELQSQRNTLMFLILFLVKYDHIRDLINFDDNYSYNHLCYGSELVASVCIIYETVRFVKIRKLPIPKCSLVWGERKFLFSNFFASYFQFFYKCYKEYYFCTGNNKRIKVDFNDFSIV